jgi:hypothetical protein
MTVGKHTRPPRTLYELLRVRPNADDDALRVAYRNAVKATHPDLNPGKADARNRFEQIVRAYEILNNPEQRAEYDALLAVERPERRARLKRVIATDVATIAALSIVLVGGYAMFAHVTQTSLETTKLVQIAEHKIARVAVVEPTAKVEPTTTAESTTPNPQSATVPEIDASVAAPGTVPPRAIPPSEYGRNPPVVASDTEAQTSVAEVAEPKDADRKGEPGARSEPAGPGNAAVAQSEPTPEAAEKTPTTGNADPSGGHAVEVAAPADTSHQAEAGQTPSREAPPGEVPSSEAPSSEPAASTAAAPNSEQPVTAGKEEPVKDDSAKDDSAKVDVNEATAPTADTGRPAEPSDASSPPEPASTANLQSPAVPEAQNADPSITGSGGPAASPTGSENGAAAKVDTATAPISNSPVDRGDVRENDRKNDSGPDPLDQTPTRPADLQAPVIGKGIELPRPRPLMTTRPGEAPDVKIAGRPRVRAVRSTADRASTKQAALESRSAPQVAFENRTNHVTPVFGVGF